MAMTIYLSIFTLNVSGVNAPIKRDRVSEWIENKTCAHADYRRSIEIKRQSQIESREMEKDASSKCK